MGQTSAKLELGGILPALLTPLLANGSLNDRSFERLLVRVYEAGSDGVYVCGNTGEGMALPSTVRKRVAEIATDNSPAGKQVVVHVGAWSLAESLDLARHAEEAGALAISSLPPAGVSFLECLHFYRELAAATALPLLAYYFPAATGSGLSLDQLEQLCALPGVVGLKFTDYDLFTMSLLFRAGKVIFNGRDEVLCAGLLLGASGGIGSIYNLVPSWFAEIFADAKAGNWDAARKQQDQVNDLIRVLLRFPFLSALKRVVTWQGIECGEALRPGQPLTAEQDEELRRLLEPMLPLTCA